MLDLELSYLGGLFDGEGSVSFTTNNIRLNTNLFVALSLCNTDLRALNLVKEYLGGSIQNNRKGVNYQVYNWYTSNISARMAAEKLIPFTLIKQDELKLACEYHDLMYPLGIKQRITSRWDKEKAEEIKQERIEIHERFKRLLVNAREKNRNTHSLLGLSSF